MVQFTATQSTRIVKAQDIVHDFSDSTNAVAYGIIIQVRQPVRGKRRRFIHISEAGHTFITLIKYNADCSSISRLFGFYTRKNNLLSATPLSALTPWQFKDDARHDWHELAGKFISQQRFDSILVLVEHYSHKPHHLRYNNCTDFGLQVASVAGICLRNTVGRWPMGHGNTTGDAGESIPEGNAINTDTDSAEGLFNLTY